MIHRPPMISVVMSVYNGEKHLKEAITSVLNQSFASIELIVIDDGSSDSTARIVQSFADLDARVRFVAIEHSGLVNALNLGCSLARAPYIARLDCDDVALPDRFRKQHSFMTSRPEISLLGGWTQCITEDGTPLFSMHWPGINENLRDFLLIDCHIAHTSIMFAKSAFDSVGGYRSSYLHAEDYDLFLRMSDRYQVDNLQDFVCKYRLHPKQVSAAQGRQQILSAIGARLATRERRAGRPEPCWKEGVVSRADLAESGISPYRIDSLVDLYTIQSVSAASGWRWAKSPFCTLVSAPQDSLRVADRCT